MGGTSNINAMIWTLGHRHVYDKKWHPSWNSQTIQESMQKAYSLVGDVSVVQASGNIHSILKLQVSLQRSLVAA